MTTREPLAPMDAAWFRMDSAEQRAVIAALMLCDGALDHEAFVARIAERVLQHPRFVERVVERAPRAPRWEADPYFDLRNHVRRIALPPPGGEAALRTLVSDLVSTPLDPDRPLWQVHVIDGAEGGTAIVTRVHHCVADGVALVRVLLGLIDEVAATPPIEVGWTPPSRKDLATRVQEARTLSRTLTLPRDPETVLHGALGPRKEVAWTSPIDVERLRGAAHARSATVNDAIMAAVAGGLRRWSSRIGRPIAEDVRALVPVFMRGGHEAASLGNAFGLVYATLPVSIADRFARLHAAKHAMDAIKATPEPSNAIAVLGAIGRLLPRAEHAAVDLLTTKASLVVTNVPGPPMAVHLVGREIRSVIVWAPVGGAISLGVTALSYRGELRVGVRGDPRALPSVDGLAEAIGRELELLACGSGDDC